MTEKETSSCSAPTNSCECSEWGRSSNLMISAMPGASRRTIVVERTLAVLGCTGKLTPPEGGHDMGQVIANASMSLDGYIAKDDNTIGRLFDWLQNGNVEVPTASPGITFHVGAASAEYWRRWVGGLGSLVCGRTLFNFTDGWGGRHTVDVPVVVVTHDAPRDWTAAHPDAPFHF